MSPFSMQGNRLRRTDIFEEIIPGQSKGSESRKMILKSLCSSSSHTAKSDEVGSELGARAHRTWLLQVSDNVGSLQV